MADWLNKLDNSSNEDADTQGVHDTAFDTTDRFSTEEILEGLEPSSFWKKHKKWWIGSLIAVIAAAFLVGLFFMLSVLSNPLRDYTQVEVVKGNVIDAIPAEGILDANRYAITSLVSGKITASTPQVGDTVAAGAVLYQLDDTEAKLAVERAQNLLSRSKVAGTTTANPDRIYATEAGTVNTLNIRSGGNVSYGQVVATIKKADETLVAVTSPVAGTVSGLHTSVGKSVSLNSLIATVTSSQASSSQRTNIYDQKTSELDVKAAEAYLDHFTIKSPVAGVIVEKNANVGDNVAMTNMEQPMMVILDTSSMKFTFRVNEYEVKELESGMDVIVNAESLPNQSFAGKISRVSPEGILGEDGKPLYEIDVTIDKPEKLRTGMKVTAKVIRASATNVMYVPHLALMEADGENAVVLVKKTPAELAEADLDTNALDEELSYPWIQVPEGCKLVRIKYGVTDGTNVEIVSGLKTGDVVVYNPTWDAIDLSPDNEEEAEPATPVPTESEDPAATPAPSSSAKPKETASGLAL